MNKQHEYTVFIAGAGAVENSWQPIIEILGKLIPEITDVDTANCFLAQTIYLMRFYASSPNPPAKEELGRWKQEYIRIKEGISKALINAENNKTIRTRPELNEILHKFIFSEPYGCVFINTNWDSVFDNFINELGECDCPVEGINIPTYHIHGNVSSPNGLYFPSEVVRETYRNSEETLEMSQTHGAILEMIRESNKTVLYGLSLDPLDAELSQILGAGWLTPNLKEIIIINPDHKKIAKRVKILLDPKYFACIKVNGYSPLNLNEKFEY